MQKMFQRVILPVLCAVLLFPVRTVQTAKGEREPAAIQPVILELPTIAVPTESSESPSPDASEEALISQRDIELIALVTMAEAEGECEEGKRLVIDTVLNRVDHERFPDNVYDVVYQPHQFSSMSNGRADRCEVRADICELVREELESRTNSDVIFFTAGRYSDYGVPMFRVEHHYFSSYD